MKHRWKNNICIKCGLAKKQKFSSELGTTKQAYSVDGFSNFVFSAPSCLTHSTDEKYCPKCSTIKPLTQFSADPSRNDGYTACCKDCRYHMTRAWSNRNPDVVRQYDRKRSHTQTRLLSTKASRKRVYERTKEDHRFYRNIRGRFRNIIRRYTGERNTVIRYVGCTRDHFIHHLESKFRDGMTWDNYGSLWEIDHIIPYSTVSKTDIEGIIRLSHYTNTQPLVKWENMVKRNIVYDFASVKTKNQGDTMEV